MSKTTENIFPTSKDVFIEINGKRLASVENYKINLKKNVKKINAFGHTEPVGVIQAHDAYEIELQRVYLIENELSEKELFVNLKDFNLIIVKPDRRIVYTGCNWSEILESAEVSDVIKEKITVIAKKRLEIL